MKLKKLVTKVLAIATIATTISTCLVGGITANAAVTGGMSAEYKTSKYYRRLVSAYNLSKDKSNMEKAAEIAKSQVGYYNYWGFIHDWTGLKWSETDDCNTEYTRWMASNVLKDKSNRYKKYTDTAWCAMFASWCLYRADVYPKNTKNKTDYAYGYAVTADPRIVRNAKTSDEKVENFNMNQKKVTYTDIMKSKLKDGADKYEYRYKTSEGWKWNCKSANKINYKKGGLIFFTWDRYNFSHVGIVYNYNKTNGILTYVAGNEGGKVALNTKNMNNIEDRKQIAAYAEY